MANSDIAQREGTRLASRVNAEHSDINKPSAWWRQDPAEIPESRLGRMADGVDRLKAIGNGQVPSVVEIAWETLSKLT